MGAPKKLEEQARLRGRRRAEWLRELVLDWTTGVLDDVPMKPLPRAPAADDLGEGILLRFRPTDLKRIAMAAKKEGFRTSSYMRAVCMNRFKEKRS
jgi:hypothetical protein